MSNRHLNIFHHYDQAGSIPIENNVSRGLAILLQDEPGLLALLLTAIRGKNITIDEPQTDYDVGFQVECSDFEDYSSVVGVALTASELTSVYNPGNASGNIGRQITDISVRYDDTLIIIEVKRDDTDCRKQLEDQINRYISCKANMNMTIRSQMCSFSWSEMMTIIKRFISMRRGKASRLLEDFYNEVITCYPSWSPQEPLKNLQIGQTDRINQRLHYIKQRYMSLYDKQHDLAYGRAAIPIDFKAASECNIGVDRSFADETGIGGDYFTVGIWPSDTCSQFWRLTGSLKDKAFLDERYTTIILPSGRTIKVRVYPYIKFCHFNKGIMWMYSNSEATNHINELLKLGDAINGKWPCGVNNSEWDKFKKLIQSCGIYSTERLDGFDIEFTEKFVNSNRSYFTSSVGFEVFAYIPYSEVQMIDAAVDSTAVAELIHDILKAFKERLE